MGQSHQRQSYLEKTISSGAKYNDVGGPEHIVQTVKFRVERVEGTVCWNQPDCRLWPDQFKSEGEDRSG